MRQHWKTWLTGVSALAIGALAATVCIGLPASAELTLLALMLGRAAFVFFAGGMIVASACGVGLSAQGLLTARALARPDAVNGAVTFSTASAFRHMAHRAAGAAVPCLLMGLVLAHLALLGGAFFLASTASGYLRKARAHSQKSS